MQSLNSRRWTLLSCGCSCVTSHDGYLHLTQKHDKGTSGPKETSGATPKHCCPYKTVLNCKVLANQNNRNTGGLCERGKQVVFIPGVSGKDRLLACDEAALCVSACLLCEEDIFYDGSRDHTALAPSLGRFLEQPSIYSVVWSSFLSFS